MFKFARRTKMPSGAGNGWVLVNDIGIEVCIRHGWRGILTFQEAVEYVNTYVRVLDDLPYGEGLPELKVVPSEEEESPAPEHQLHVHPSSLSQFRAEIKRVADIAAAQASYGT